MDLNNQETTANSSANRRSVFFCPHAPQFIYHLNETTFPWILAAILCTASPATVTLNALVIIAVRRRRQLQKFSNILLSSMAVADLLVGAVSMPLSVTVDLLIVRRIFLKQNICVLELVNPQLLYFLFVTSLYHLTAIAWERYVAVTKSMDYKTIVTRRRTKMLAVFAWISAIITVSPGVVLTIMGSETQEIWLMVQSLIGFFLFISIIYFYLMVYLRVCKHRVSPNSQVASGTKLWTKLESKVTKTTCLLTVTLFISMAPSTVFTPLGTNFPILRTNVVFRVNDTLVQLVSLVNPLLYWFRDRQFRKAVLELLRIRRRRASQLVVGAARSARRKALLDLPKTFEELQIEDNRTRLTRSATRDQVQVFYAHRGSTEVTSARSRRKSLSFSDGSERQGLSSTFVTTTTVHADKRRKDLDGRQSTVHRKRMHKLSRSKSLNAISFEKSSNNTKPRQERFVVRQKTTPSFHW